VTVVTAHRLTKSVSCLLLRTGERHKLVRVNRMRTAVVLGAVLLWAATPTMACLLPGLLQTEAERRCCHHMAEHCGPTAMPSSHACCHAPNHQEALVVQEQGNLPLKNAIAAVPATTHVRGPFVLAVSLRPLAFCESPPGQLPSRSSSALRI